MSISKRALAFGLKIHGTKKFPAWCKAMEATGEVARAEDAKVAVEKVVKADKASAALAALTRSLSGLEASSSLAKLVRANPDADIRVGVSDGKVTFTVASTKRRSGSCISARTAVAAGNKKGDDISFPAIEKEARGHLGLSQRAILFRDFPGSHAVAKLRQYGYTG